jgi:hypothetical protein
MQTSPYYEHDSDVGKYSDCTSDDCLKPVDAGQCSYPKVLVLTLRRWGVLRPSYTPHRIVYDTALRLVGTYFRDGRFSGSIPIHEWSDFKLPRTRLSGAL